MTKSPEQPSDARNECSSPAGVPSPSTVDPQQGALPDPPEYAVSAVEAVIASLAESGYHLQRSGSYPLTDARADAARIIAARTADPAVEMQRGRLVWELCRLRELVCEEDQVTIDQVLIECASGVNLVPPGLVQKLKQQRDGLQAIVDKAAEARADGWRGGLEEGITRIANSFVDDGDVAARAQCRDLIILRHLATAGPATSKWPTCPRKCEVCRDSDHHWIAECNEETGEPRWACKHCPATKPYEPDEESEAAIAAAEPATPTGSET